MKKYILLLLLPCLVYAQNTDHEIALPVGWSLFSTYILPENNTLDDIFSSIINDVVAAERDVTGHFLPQTH